MLWSAAPHIEQCIVTPMFGSFLQSILIPFLLWIFLSKITPFQTKSFLHNNPQQNPSPITPEKGPMPFTTVLISHITLTKDGHLPREIEDTQAPQPYPAAARKSGWRKRTTELLTVGRSFLAWTSTTWSIHRRRRHRSPCRAAPAPPPPWNDREKSKRKDTKRWRQRAKGQGVKGTYVQK